jgi:hypothetical protein
MSSRRVRMGAPVVLLRCAVVLTHTHTLTCTHWPDEEADDGARGSQATAMVETQRLLRNLGAHTQVLAVLELRLLPSPAHERRVLLQTCHAFLQQV